jgi:hypothetical protein
MAPFQLVQIFGVMWVRTALLFALCLEQFMIKARELEGIELMRHLTQTCLAGTLAFASAVDYSAGKRDLGVCGCTWASGNRG